MTDQIALVTGASRGIGQAIARCLARNGYRVIGTATTDSGAALVSTTFSDAGYDGQGMRLDVTDSIAINEVIEQIQNQFGAPTILVNNAGITRDNLLLRMKQDDWDTILDTNLTSVYRMTKACLRGMMKARGGRIVNITSVVAATGNPGQSNYAAAKAGIIGFTKSLAREVSSRNITVNAVAPGFIETEMTNALPEEQRKALLDSIPMNRLGTVEDVAEAVAFLVSPAAGYISGETLHVNGGMHMP